MLEILHREAPYPAAGWEFSCLTVARINGAGRTYADSVAASKHCARQYLSREAGYPLVLEDAARLLRHTPPEASGACSGPGSTAT